MSGDPDLEKLDEMAARIRQAKTGPQSPAAEGPREKGDAIRAGRVGFDFVATVGGCIALGWLIDREFGTPPWGLLAMMLIGFVAGITNVWRALGGYDQAVGWHKKKTKE
jgi:ATP synthase protein I